MTQNLIKTCLFLTLTSGLTFVLGGYLYGRQGLLIGFVVAVLWIFFVLFYSHQNLHKLFLSKKIEGADPWKIGEMVSELASHVQIPKPNLFICESTTPIAFCFGLSRSNASIGISKSLIEILTLDELKAILAHQVFHIKQLDILSFQIGRLVMGGLLVGGRCLDHCLAFIFKWMSKSNKRELKQNVKPSIGFFTSLLMPIALFCLRLIINPKSDDKSDHFAGQSPRKPEDMAKALWKLASYCQAKPLNISPAIAHFFIINPLPDDLTNNYFHKMPKVEDRIRKLIGRYPI